MPFTAGALQTLNNNVPTTKYIIDQWIVREKAKCKRSEGGNLRTYMHSRKI